MKAPGVLFHAVALLALGCPASAQEKNGISLSVSKKTLDRNDLRRNYYASDRIDRTQGLRATIRNVTFKPNAEMELKWTILVRKYYSTQIEGARGTETVPALKPSETIELVFGAANITGWSGSYDYAKDKMEWQVILLRDGKEINRAQSTQGFDAIAGRAFYPTGRTSTVSNNGQILEQDRPKRATPAPATPAPLRATPPPLPPVRATPVPALPGRATPSPPGKGFGEVPPPLVPESVPPPLVPENVPPAK